MAQAQPTERHAAPPPQEQSSAGAKVSVACKLPAGLVIRGFIKGTEYETVQGGGTRAFDVWRWTGAEHVIFGTAVPLGQIPKCLVIGGYAITPGVDKDLFDNWFAANRDGELVKKHLIFAYERAGDAEAEAKNSAAIQSGFEPIDPENPAKKFRGPEFKGIERSTRK